jgi:hypothetical protein
LSPAAASAYECARRCAAGERSSALENFPAECAGPALVCAGVRHIKYVFAAAGLLGAVVVALVPQRDREQEAAVAAAAPVPAPVGVGR